MNRRHLLGRLLKLLRPLWPVMAFSVTARILNLLSGAALLAVSAYAVGRLIAGKGLPVEQVAITLIALSLLKGLFRYLEQYTGHYVAFHLLAKLRYHFYRALELQMPTGAARWRSGDVVSRVMADVDRIEPFYAHTIAPFLTAVITPLCFLSALALYHFGLAASLLPFLLLVGVFVPLLVDRWNRVPSQHARALAGEVNALFTDSLQGLREVLAFNYGARRQTILRQAGMRLRNAQARLAHIGATQHGLVESLIASGTLILLWVSARLVQQDVLTVADIPVIIALGWMAFQPLLGITMVINDFNTAMTSAARLFALMDQPPQVREPANPKALPATRALDLRFQHVSFQYPDAFHDGNCARALDDFTLDIPFGSILAIVGASGAGKSTLVSLLLRFWDPTSGRITLNGIDLRELALADLRAQIAVVSQQTYIFNTTLFENIRLAKPDADEAQVIAAAQRACLHDFISTLPQGYATVAGEMGHRLSGGQRQRLALARAFLKDAPILVLDEATANLDPETERAIQVTLQEAMQGRTTIIIAHRLSAVRVAKDIVVLEQGKLVERGSHTELMRQNGVYARLFRDQQDLWEILQQGGK